MTRKAAELTPLDAADPVGRPGQMNPVLAGDQIGRMVAFGVRERAASQTQLFRRGDRERDLLVVLSGAIEVYDLDDRGAERVLVVHGPGQLSGELDLFDDHQILVSARTGEDCEFVRIRKADVRRLITSEPDLGETILRAFMLRRIALVRHSLGGVLVVGRANDGEALRIRSFLGRNGYPHRVLDPETNPDARALVQRLAVTADQLPVVIDVDCRVLSNPSNTALADALGMTESISPDRVFDVAVVGAGPAGLAAAVYAASEGLHTIVIEGTAPGGQAGTSSKIENYLGFPTGISGEALAGRAQVQAIKFGAKVAISRNAVRLDCQGSPYRLELEGGESVAAKAVVVATGVRYRRLDVPNYARFEGRGIHYAATAMEAALCKDQEVVVVGAGNSAGQAAVFLARHAAHVHILSRSGGLGASMSSYLVDRIAASPRITVHPFCEITAVDGDRALREVTWTDRRTGAAEKHAIANLFAMIGAEPRTDWLGGCLALDDRGFVLTGQDRDGRPLRSPFATALPGVFAVGDVRSGSVKRVASAVGEGSVVVQSIHELLGGG